MRITSVSHNATRFCAIVVPPKSTDDRLATIFLNQLLEMTGPNSKLLKPGIPPDQYYNFYQDLPRKLPMYARIYWPKDGTCRILPWPNHTGAIYYIVRLADGVITKKENSVGDDQGKVEPADKAQVQTAIFNSHKAYKLDWFS